MPTSWYQAIPNILTQVRLLNPESILDIGIGFGKYGLLFRDQLEIPFMRYEKNNWKVKIDGVEVFETYHNPVYDFAYDKVYFGDILKIVDTLQNYDCITLIDVLEHFSKEEGLLLIEKLVHHCNKGVIVSTPFYPDPQSDYLGNTFEQHKSVWSIVDFEHFNFNYERVVIEQNGAHIFVFKKAAQYHKMPFEVLTCKDETIKKPLKITYLLPHKNLTGGLKMLLQQIKYLKKRGHEIFVCLKSADEKQTAIPNWFDLEVDKEIIIPTNKTFLQYIPSCDIIVAGWVTQLIELENSKIPVVYWEQGNEWLFGDFVEQKQINSILKVLERCYLTKHALLSVSPYVSNVIYARFGRKTPILPNGIDTKFYCFGEKGNINKILLIGNPHLAFKGFNSAFKALNLAWIAGFQFCVEWICQAAPKLPDVPFPISTLIQPTQKELVKSYQNADIHLFTSWYEGFGMPPLEAMSCGTPVVCSKCGGINSILKNGYNALTSEPGNIKSMAANIIYLLKFPEARGIFSQNGIKTAEKFDYSNIILTLENYLYSICSQYGFTHKL